jgi:hypothetical protein
MPIPAPDNLNSPQFADHVFDHVLKLPDRFTVAQFPVLLLHPGDQPIFQIRGPGKNGPADPPKVSSQVIPGQPHGQAMVHPKQAGPVEPTIAHDHWRQHRKRAHRALGIAATISLHFYHPLQKRGRDMKPLAGIGPMPIALTTSALRARRHKAFGSTGCSSYKAIFYIHSGRVVSPFPPSSEVFLCEEKN